MQDKYHIYTNNNNIRISKYDYKKTPLDMYKAVQVHILLLFLET